MKQIGKTTCGLAVVDGVYSFFETHGLPLADIISECHALRSIPCWNTLLRDMTQAGRKEERAREAILSAVFDSTLEPWRKQGIAERLSRAR